jgi:hypothetical protein
LEKKFFTSFNEVIKEHPLARKISEGFRRRLLKSAPFWYKN